MPNTKTSRRALKRRLGRREQNDVEAETGTSIIDHLREIESGVEAFSTRIRSLERENGILRAEQQQFQQNVHNSAWSGNSGPREKAVRHQIQLLERTIIDLKTAQEKDRRTIEKLRDTEVKRDAEDLADDHDRGATQETLDLGEEAIKLLRRVSDTIDMNTLAEGEECTICMEEMAVEKCHSLPCRHPVCVKCFERLGNVSNTVFNHQTESIQCSHCREICRRSECEVITHTAVQQWDLLLDTSREWAKVDVGEIDIGEEEESFINDGSVAATESPRTLEEAADFDPEISTASTSPNDTGPVASKSLPSPLKRKRLSELAAQRAVKQRV